MMTHHDARSYADAASDAARHFRGQFDALIQKGSTRAGDVIQNIVTTQPTDRIVQGRLLRFSPTEEGVAIENRTNKGATPVHRHALTQLAARQGLPDTYASRLLERGDWGRELLAENLNELYDHDGAEQKYLLRFVRPEARGPELRGFLSDSYRRMDSVPIVESFAKALEKMGALPFEGISTDTKWSVKAVLNTIHEPVANEPMAYGVYLKSSDFGDGALELGLWMLRGWCTNLAMLETSLKKVHLGRRLSEDLSLSAATYKLDTATMASAIADVTQNLLAPARIETVNAAVKVASEQKVTAQQALGQFKALGLTKTEVAEATDAFNSPEIEKVPAGQTMWRLSNSISWLAGRPEVAPDRRIELMQAAGKLVKLAA